MRIVKWLFKNVFKIISNLLQAFLKKFIKKDHFYSLIDLETTGLYKNDKIVEISVRKVDIQGNEVLHFETLINPERDVGPQSIHGISALDVKNAPKFRDIVGDLLETLDNSVLVGHNIDGFDLKFLNREFDNSNFPLNINKENTLDSLRFAKDLKYPLKLEKLYKSIVKGSKFKKIDFHKASEDTKALLNIFKTNEFRNWALRQKVRPLFFDNIPNANGDLVTRGGGIDKIDSFIEKIKYSENIVDLEFDELRLNQYSLALQSYIEDKEVSEGEREKLQELVTEYNLTIAEAEEVHKHIFDSFVDIALLDAKITNDEMYKLQQISKLLGLGAYLEESISKSKNGTLKDKVLDKAISVLPLKRESSYYLEDLKNEIICFTGEINIVASGFIYDKDGLTSASKKQGLNISSTFNKKVTLLVAQDVFSQSNKVLKAKSYGIRILDSNDFARKIGIIPDSL